MERRERLKPAVPLRETLCHHGLSACVNAEARRVVLIYSSSNLRSEENRYITSGSLPDDVRLFFFNKRLSYKNTCREENLKNLACPIWPSQKKKKKKDTNFWSHEPAVIQLHQLRPRCKDHSTASVAFVSRNTLVRREENSPAQAHFSTLVLLAFLLRALLPVIISVKLAKRAHTHTHRPRETLKKRNF